MKRVIVAALFMLLAGSASASCPGVDHSRVVDETWTTHTVSGLILPSVEFEVGNVAAGTTVEVYSNGTWSAVGAGTHTGTRLRLTTGGEIDVSYRVGECEDIIEPIDN